MVPNLGAGHFTFMIFSCPVAVIGDNKAVSQDYRDNRPNI